MSDPEGSWLITPPGDDEVRMFVAIGDDVEISEEAMRALETLVREIGEADVAGHAQSVQTALSRELSTTCGTYFCWPLCAANTWPTPPRGPSGRTQRDR
jgi:hypothetical protein